MQTYISIETTAFSGATLLAFLLGAHPSIATVGELSGLIARSDPETYLCSCGQRIKDCQFWCAVTAEMAARGYPFNIADFEMRFDFPGPQFVQRLREGSLRNPRVDALRDKILFALPREGDQIKRKAFRNAALIEIILNVTGRQVFVDSSKSRMRIRALRHFSTLDVRAIHLVRRVEGVVASQLRRNPGMDAAQPARDWARRHHRLDTTLQTWLGDKYLRVRYEDICQDPEQTLARLFQFCGLAADVYQMQFDVSAQHIIGNPMRLRPLSALEVDARWKDELSPRQLDAVYQEAGALNRRYGYM